MNGFLIVFHSLGCILLITVILMQSGRGGGLTEAFSSAESMFGAQTNSFMVRLTTVLAVIYIGGCLALAFVNVDRNKSLIMSQPGITNQFNGDLKLPEESSMTIEIPMGDASTKVPDAVDSVDEAIKNAESQAATKSDEMLQLEEPDAKVVIPVEQDAPVSLEEVAK